MTRTVFTTERFTPTQCFSAEEKARFCNDFVRFVLSGFDRKLFKPKFYQRLSNIFGHIAHYDADGFWEVWFASPAKQCQFVQRVHEWVPVGDPHFCWSDAERELKSWATKEAEAVEAAIVASERKFTQASKVETDRRAALANQTHQQFKVMAKSSNIGSFGHRQYVMVAQDGSAWKVQRTYLYPWETGQVVNVPLINGEPDWCSIQGVECPEQIEDCPVEA
jgi:hypothetical protein